ncbi:MAG: DUF2267 domain-containing protein [Actinobacteria bacterium]|nr:MAG: DUF2267 domain-containing protein [Actinomycetota bacterium]
MMDTRQFLNRVKDEASLPDDRQAKNITEAVLTTLHSRIKEGEADDVEATLPTEIKELWEGDIGQKITKHLGAVDKLNKGQFIARVQDKARIATTEEAEQKTKAVIKVLKEAIPDGEVKDLSAQLPEDLRDFVKAA